MKAGFWLMALCASCAFAVGSTAFGDATYWLGGSGSPLNVWTDPANWQDGLIPEYRHQSRYGSEGCE